MGSLDKLYSKSEKYKKLAKQLGYESRAIFKLIEIDKKYNIFQKNSIVLDLGFWPGGWLEYSSKKSKLCIGVDIKEKKLNLPNVKTIKKDIYDEDIINVLKKESDNYDVILSDMMSNTTGQKELDSYNSFLLSVKALNISKELLNKNGFFICKIFQSKESNEFLKICRNVFNSVKTFKPKSSRKNSREVYIVCKELK